MNRRWCWVNSIHSVMTLSTLIFVEIEVAMIAIDETTILEIFEKSDYRIAFRFEV